jgi:hypothetical protein
VCLARRATLDKGIYIIIRGPMGCDVGQGLRKLPDQNYWPIGEGVMCLTVECDAAHCLLGRFRLGMREDEQANASVLCGAEPLGR